MNVHVRLFARQRQLAGTRELPIILPEMATVADAWRAVVAAHPALAGDAPYVRFARNGIYATPEEQLSDGDEVACIPPVAGGGHETGEPLRTIAFTDAPIDDATVADLCRRVATARDGALVTFVGRTRQSPGTPAPGEEREAARHLGQRVIELDYEAYESMALRVIDVVADEIADRFGVVRLAILHRVGRVAVGEASVAIVVAAPHRSSAFDACRYAIDELKARAPIWKAERFADGSVWLGAPARPGPLGAGE